MPVVSGILSRYALTSILLVCPKLVLMSVAFTTVNPACVAVNNPVDAMLAIPGLLLFHV